MTDRDKNLIEELEKRLYWYREEATKEEFDAEEVDAICVMLQKLSPIKEPHMSKAEAYQNIMRRVREEEEAESSGEAAGIRALNEADGKEKRGGERKKRRFFEGRGSRAAILFIAVFGAALVSLNMVTYAREDKSLFTMILERVGVFEIVKDNSNISIIDGGETSELFYDSWTELDKEIKQKIEVPRYIPEGYGLYGITYYNHNNRERVKADYYNKKNGHLLIEITLWEDNPDQYKEKAIDEDIYMLLPEYSDENTLFYEYEDEYICMVSMKKGFYRVSGNIALEEMVKVREGLENLK